MTSIYFILCRGSGAVKVGWARNVERRLAEHQCGCPFDLELIGLVDGSRLDEARTHAALSHDRIRGEWFAEQAARKFLHHAMTDGLQAVLAAFEAELDRRCAQIKSDVAEAMLVINSELPPAMRARDKAVYLAEQSLRDPDFLNRWLNPLGMVFDGQRIVQMSLAA